MPTSEEISTKKDRLFVELNELSNKHQRLGRRNRLAGNALMVVALVASALAGLGGLAFHFSGQATGALALVPGIMALAATHLRFDGKAHWHYRLRNAMTGLTSRLEYVPELTAESVAEVAEAKSKCIVEFQEAWERELTMSWTGFSQGATNKP